MRRTVPVTLLALLVVAVSGADAPAGPPVAQGIPYLGQAPGRSQGKDGFLANAVLEADWRRDVPGPGGLRFFDVERGKTWALGDELFTLRLRCGSGASETVPASKLTYVSSAIQGMTTIQARFQDPEGRFEAAWQATLEDDAHYVRTTVTIKALGQPLVVESIQLFDAPIEGAERIGSVPGSVVRLEGVFVAVEHPMAENDAGYPLTRVGTWAPATCTWPETSAMRWDVTKALSQAGTVEALFQYTSGGHRLEIHGARLLRGDEEVAKDGHFGATGSADVENRFRFALPSYDPKATYTLEIQGRSDGGTDSHGWVGIAQVAGPPRVTGALETETELSPGQSTSLGAVMGVFPEGQLRRSVLRYVERERAHPYRPFLHYNSWYDIGYFSKYDEAACLDVVRAYGEELVKKRGGRIDSFLFDDGWDDTESLWDFHDGLPNGFAKVRALTESYGAGPGVWLSPWGGYGKPRKARLAAGKAAGYETTDAGFALSAPKYYERFRAICLEMVDKYGANHFKFDGVRRGGGRYPGSAFGSDFEAALALIGALREARPDVYINQTTGTWPSPFWLLFADSIWRGGWDHEFTGEGTKRQQWITYRDAKTYENVVRGGPLFPISSLMLHGVIYAKHARGLKDDPQNDLRDEIRTAFGCGTQLQELYVTPSLLTEQNWDDLAAAAAWGRARAHVLRDVHWVGGSPADLEVYGWAAWAPGEGTLTLRNPSSKAQVFALDIGAALELPEGAPRSWSLVSPWPDQEPARLHAAAGLMVRVTLQPFEVLMFDATPAK